jgi:hypothetical protein
MKLIITIDVTYWCVGQFLNYSTINGRNISFMFLVYVKLTRIPDLTVMSVSNP